MTSGDRLFGIRIENKVRITCVFNANSTSTKRWAVGYLFSQGSNRMCFVLVYFFTSQSTAMVMLGWSVHLIIFLGKLDEAVSHYFVHIL